MQRFADKKRESIVQKGYTNKNKTKAQKREKTHSLEDPFLHFLLFSYIILVYFVYL